MVCEIPDRDVSIVGGLILQSDDVIDGFPKGFVAHVAVHEVLKLHVGGIVLHNPDLARLVVTRFTYA